MNETYKLRRPQTCGDTDTRSQRSFVLQHFEFAVITAVSHLGDRAFPAELARHLSNTLERHVSLAQVFIALERMEDKGLVSSRDEKPSPVRGGRRRRIFQVEASGARAIENTAATFRMSHSEEMSNVAKARQPKSHPA